MGGWPELYVSCGRAEMLARYRDWERNGAMCFAVGHVGQRLEEVGAEGGKAALSGGGPGGQTVWRGRGKGRGAAALC